MKNIYGSVRVSFLAMLTFVSLIGYSFVQIPQALAQGFVCPPDWVCAPRPTSGDTQVLASLDPSSPVTSTVQISTTSVTPDVALARFDLMAQNQPVTLKSFSVGAIVTVNGTNVGPGKFFSNMHIVAGDKTYYETSEQGQIVKFGNLDVPLSVDGNMPITVYGSIPKNANNILDGSSVSINLPLKGIYAVDSSQNTVLANQGTVPNLLSGSTITFSSTPSVNNGAVVEVIGNPTLALLYDTNQRESSLEARFNFTVKAGNNPINILAQGSGITFLDQNGQNGNANQSGTAITPMNQNLTTGYDNYGQLFYVVPEGRKANFLASSSISPQILFAGAYHASLVSILANNGAIISNEYNMPIAANRTNTKNIVGELSPYISSITPAVVSVGQKLSINGVRLAGANNFDAVYIDGVRTTALVDGSKDGTTLFFTLPTSPITTGNHVIYVVDSVTGKSNNKGFQVTGGSIGSQSIVITNVQYTPANPQVNQYITTTVTVQNNGTTDVTRPFRVNVQGTTATIPYLAAGAVNTVTVPNAFSFSYAGPETLNTVIIDPDGNTGNMFTNILTFSSATPTPPTPTNNSYDIDVSTLVGLPKQDAIRKMYIALQHRDPVNGDMQGLTYWANYAADYGTIKSLMMSGIEYQTKQTIVSLFLSITGRYPSDIELAFWYNKAEANNYNTDVVKTGLGGGQVPPPVVQTPPTQTTNLTPNVTFINPQSGAAGDSITIYGSGFNQSASTNPNTGNIIQWYDASQRPVASAWGVVSTNGGTMITTTVPGGKTHLDGQAYFNVQTCTVTACPAGTSNLVSFTVNTPTTSVIPPAPPLIVTPPAVVTPPDVGTASLRPSRSDSVNGFYVSLLRRPADTSGLNYYVNSSWTLDQIKANMMSSTEYKTVVIVTNLYQTLVNRTPDDQGLRFYVSKILSDGWTVDQVKANMMSSDEYKKLHPLTTPSAPATQTSSVWAGIMNLFKQ